MFKAIGADYSDPLVHRSLSLIFEGGTVYCGNCHGFRPAAGTKLLISGELVLNVAVELAESELYRFEESKWSALVQDRIHKSKVSLGVLEPTFKTPEDLKHYVIGTKNGCLHLLCQRLEVGATLTEFYDFLDVELLMSKVIL